MVKNFQFIKSLLTIGVISFGVLAALSYALGDLVEKTQNYQARQQLESLKSYLHSQLSEFEVLAEKWSKEARFLDVYRSNSLQKRKKLLLPAQFSGAAVDAVVLFDSHKKVILSKSFSPKGQQFKRLNTKLSYIFSKDEFLEFMSPVLARSTYVFADKLYRVSSVPVYQRNNAEEVSGYLVLAKAISLAEIESDNLIKLELTAVDFAKNSKQSQLFKKMQAKDVFHQQENAQTQSSLIVRGINDRPLMLISSRRSNATIEDIMQTGWLSFLVLFALVFVLAYFLWWNQKRGLCLKINNLERDIANVRIGTELSSRLSDSERGVLAGIVTALNQKIGGFEQTFVENRKHDAEIVLNELPLEAYLKDTGLKYITVNQKYCDFLDCNKVDIVGRSDSELMSEQAAARVAEKEREAIDSRESVIYEEAIVTTNNEEIYYTTHLIPFLNSKNQVEGVVGVRIDITDHKLAKEEMEMASKVLENTAEGVMVTDAERNVVHVNKAYSELTGYKESELLGKVPLLLQSNSQSKTYQEIQDSLDKNGVWKGELWSSRKDGSSYPEMINIKSIRNSHGEITNYFSMSKDIAEQKKWEQQLYQMAHYDALTGLANRTLFKDRLSQEIKRCQRNKKNLAVLFIDIDLFKSINDSLGHAAGDILLKIIAERLKPALRSADSIARMGGDEFTILVTDLALDYQKNIGYLKRLCEKIIETVKQPMELEGRQINVTCSIGVAVYPVDASNNDDLLRNADSAMYFAKSQGRRNYQFYSKEFNEKAVERLEKEIEFRAALKGGELELYYQPQVDVITRHIVGAEALLRWQKNDKAVLGPEKIIALAEETGLIYELGNWILETACLECKKWLNNGHKNLRVAVNLSTRQFRQKDLVDIIDSILTDTALPGRLLELEVTESALMENIEYSTAMMAELSARGIRWSLDDFGTGYSSLNYLREFPVHVLKIDQSFVREISVNPEDSAIVGTIIDLAHKLHLTVVAEGVETEDHLKVLGLMGCELVQGYYFSKPMQALDFSEHISRV